MQRSLQRTTAIVIPTGRNGFCCIIPCALLFMLYGIGGVAVLALARRFVRHRRSEKRWERS